MRNTVKAMMLVRELKEKHGVEIVSVSDPAFDRDTAAGVYLEAITFAKNEAYSREVAFHTRKGCRANIRTRDPETGWCYKNGGSASFGNSLKRLERGTNHGRPIYKTIWVPNEEIVSGRPVREWARTLLVELAGEGYSLDYIRDFLNRNKIPAARKQFWNTSTLYSLLESHSLLKYAGHDV
jgi:hypothetical protein